MYITHTHTHIVYVHIYIYTYTSIFILYTHIHTHKHILYIYIYTHKLGLQPQLIMGITCAVTPSRGPTCTRRSPTSRWRSCCSTTRTSTARVPSSPTGGGQWVCCFVRLSLLFLVVIKGKPPGSPKSIFVGPFFFLLNVVLRENRQDTQNHFLSGVQVMLFSPPYFLNTVGSLSRISTDFLIFGAPILGLAKRGFDRAQHEACLLAGPLGGRWLSLVKLRHL